MYLRVINVFISKYSKTYGNLKAEEKIISNSSYNLKKGGYYLKYETFAFMFPLANIEKKYSRLYSHSQMQELDIQSNFNTYCHLSTFIIN